jgi:hypothetical protein
LDTVLSFQPRIAKHASGQPADVLLGMDRHPDFVLRGGVNQFPVAAFAKALFEGPW